MMQTSSDIQKDGWSGDYMLHQNSSGTFKNGQQMKTEQRKMKGNAIKGHLTS